MWQGQKDYSAPAPFTALIGMHRPAHTRAPFACSQTLLPSSNLYPTQKQKPPFREAFVFGRGRKIRTLDTRFWRPMLYQLSYTPTLFNVDINTHIYVINQVFFASTVIFYNSQTNYINGIGYIVPPSLTKRPSRLSNLYGEFCPRFLS